MSQLYVICESGFEYNDEIYHKPESEGGIPVVASSDEKKANAKCEEMNFKRFCSEFGDLSRFFYDPSEKFSEEAVAVLKKNNVLLVDKLHRSRQEYLEWNPKAKWQEIPADDLMEIYKGCQIRWYEVYEVDKTV